MRILLAWLLLSCPLWAHGPVPNTFRYGAETARQDSRGWQQVADKPAEPFCLVQTMDGGRGSGVLVDVNGGKGLVITNHHVVRGTQLRSVTFRNGQTVSGKWAGVDKTGADLAALIVEQPNAYAVKVGRYTGQGNHGIAGFGRPQDPFRQAIGRPMGVVTTGYPGKQFQSVQFNCFIRPGDSGAAVLNSRGEYVGNAWGCEAPARHGPTLAVVGQPVMRYLASLCQCYGPNCQPVWQPSQSFRRQIVIQQPAGPESPPLTIPPSVVQPEPQPERPVVIPDIDPDLDRIREEMAKLREELLAGMQPGPQGPPGEQGPPGLDADPTVLIQFNSRLSALEAELADKDTLASQLASRLPVSLQQVDKDGRPIGPLQKRNLTEPLNIGAYLVERE